MSKKSPSVILWDVETSNLITAVFSLYQDSIHHSNIIEDWYIFCISYKYLGESRVHSISITDDAKRFKKNPKDDYYVVKTMGEILREADMTIGHNEVAFDRKKLNARLIYHKLPPVPKIPSVDTLKEYRKIAKFTSNRLDYLGQHLGFGGKVQTESGLWMKALNGDAKALKKMSDYCDGDVELLEKIYNRILPHIQSHPHIGSMEGKDKNLSCPKCGSTKLMKAKQRPSASGLQRQQWQCVSCGGYHTTAMPKD